MKSRDDDARTGAAVTRDVLPKFELSFGVDHATSIHVTDVTSGLSVFDALRSPERDRQAFLIAAAPELLEAVKVAQSLVCSDYCTEKHDLLCERWTALVAKAEGRT